MSDSGSTHSVSPISNLSKINRGLRERALRSLAQILGVTLGAPVVDRVRADIDTLEGRSTIRKMLAEEAGRRAIADPEIMSRAMDRFLGQEFRKQENIETVAHLAIEDLAKCGDARPLGDDTEVDDDWLNIFSSQAEKASSNKMRDLLSKILSGEIRKPGSFSPSTLRVVAEMDQEMANDLQVMSLNVVGKTVVSDDSWNSTEMTQLGIRLSRYGFLDSPPGNLNLGMQDGMIVLPGTDARLVLRFATKTDASEADPIIAFGFVGKIGQQLVSLLPKPDELSLMRRHAAYAKTYQNAQSASIYNRSSPPVLVEDIY